ncbi:hypothetical protein TNCV_4016561 [Trichonephila clavipes]|nr:hypothetical protein TNCV_4016561 [Trichonephila clavipes]
MGADSENVFDITTLFLSPTSRQSVVSIFYKKKASVNSTHCVEFSSHIGATNDLNEEECQPVVTHQCQCDKAISSPPDGEQHTMSELGSDVPAYYLQAPRSRTKVRRAVCRSAALANQRWLGALKGPSQGV